jgi:hypothetical protein
MLVRLLIAFLLGLLAYWLFSLFAPDTLAVIFGLIVAVAYFVRGGERL